MIEVLPPFSVKIVAVCILWYFVSFVTLQLLKIILIRFAYPLFLSSVQFFFGIILSWLQINVTSLSSRYFNHRIGKSMDLSPGLYLASSIFNRDIIVQVLPLGVFQFFGKFFLLNATRLILLATVLSIKALSPLFIIAGYRIIYSVKLPIITYFLLIPLLLGVLMIVSAEAKKNLTEHLDLNLPNFDPILNLDLKDESPSLILTLINQFYVDDIKELKGVFYCLISTVIFAGQNIYLKRLVTGKTNSPTSLLLNTDTGDRSFTSSSNSQGMKNGAMEMLPYSAEDITQEKKKMRHLQALPNNNRKQKLDKIVIIFYVSIIGFLFSFFGFLTNELPVIWKNFQMHDENEDESIVDTTAEAIEIIILVTVDSLSHFGQTLLSFYVLSLLPALLYSIALLIKRVFLVTISILVVVQSHLAGMGLITRHHIVGLIFLTIGLYSYDRWGSTAVKHRN